MVSITLWHKRCAKRPWMTAWASSLLVLLLLLSCPLSCVLKLSSDATTNKIIGFDLSMDLVDEIENEKSKGTLT